jgi:hypothetical protein
LSFARNTSDRHTRESGYPVITAAHENIERPGILDHPLSRMMTVARAFSSEVDTGSREENASK